MKASRVCELREDFLREWQRDFPLVPPPVLRGIDVVRRTDVIDESQASGFVATLWGSLHTVNNKLDQLNEQILRKQRLKDFLVCFLQTFDGDNFVARSRLDDDKNNPSARHESITPLNVNNIEAVTVGTTAKSGATIVAVTSPTCVTSYQSNVNPSENRSVFSVSDGCASDSIVCSNSGTTPPFSRVNNRNIKEAVEKACSSCVFNNTSEIGIQCMLIDVDDLDYSSRKTEKNLRVLGSEDISGVNNYKVGPSNAGSKNDVYKGHVSCNGYCSDKSKECVNTEVCHCSSKGNNEYIKKVDYNGEEFEEEIYYYDNRLLNKHIAMFKRRKGSGLLRPGDESGSQRGSKDNFLAVTSQEKLSEGGNEDKTLDIESQHRHGGSSLSSNSTLTRNFQMLKLTPGFDLVLGNNDEKSNKNAPKGIDDRLEAKFSQRNADNKLKTKEFGNENDNEDDERTPTLADSDVKMNKFDYNDISEELDNQTPDLVSSTFRKNNTMTNQDTHFVNNNTDTNKQSSSGPTNNQPSSPSSSIRDDPKLASTPPPVARKPSRSSFGKKLPPIPVGVEPVTRNLTNITNEQSGTIGNQSLDVCRGQTSTQRENGTVKNQPTTLHKRTDEHTKLKETTYIDDPSVTFRSSPSSTIQLSSSPDFHTSLSAGIIPVVPNANVAIDHSNPARSSHFYYDLDTKSNTAPIPHDSSGNSVNVKAPTCSDQSSLNDNNETINEKSGNITTKRRSVEDLIRAANSTISKESENTSTHVLGDNSRVAFTKNESKKSESDGINERCVGSLGKNEGANRLLNQELTSPSSLSSPPNPLLQKRESRFIPQPQTTGSKENATQNVYSEKRENDGCLAENDTKMIEVVSSVASSTFTGDTATRSDYIRMSSTDTLVNEQSSKSRRSESFTSDADVKDAISIFDQMLEEEDPLDDLSMESTIDTKDKRRKSSVISYQNWTINRALTSAISNRILYRSGSASIDEFKFNFTDDDDTPTTNFEDSTSNTSTIPSPDLGGTRAGCPTNGSKDSGLCEDMTGMSESVHSELDLSGGRINDLRQIQEMERWEEEQSTSHSRREISSASGNTKHFSSDMDKDFDSVSITSDIVYLSGSLAKKRVRQGSDTTGTDDILDISLTEEDSDDVIVIDKGTEDDDDDDDDNDTNRSRRACRLDTSSTASSLDLDEDGRSMNTSYDETDSGREGMLKMRQLLIKGVLDSEKAYLGILGLLIHYKKVMEASSRSSQPVVSDSDIQAIFSNIEVLHAIHTNFVTSLEAKVKDWSHADCVGEIFKIFVLEFPEFCTYVNNYPNAVSTIIKCAQDCERFQDISKQIVIKSTIKEHISLEDALFKPVQRVQRNSLVLHDLIRYTPEDHTDYEVLQKALKLSQHNLENFVAVLPHYNTTPENRHLVKSSFLVELVNGVRKLRYMFLFSDILICTKRETHRNNKVSFQIKWFAPLAKMTYDTKNAYNDDVRCFKKEEINELKNKIKTLKKELRMEMKKFDGKDKHRSLVNIGGAARTVEKLRKKILQNEGQMILASPRLPFKVSLEGGKVYTMLMTTDYEKEEWKEALNSLSKRIKKEEPLPPFSSIFIQDLIDSVKETPQVNKIGSVLLQKDEDIMSGTLNVTIHKMNGLTEECDTYCCLEMDSFGHFFMMARTKLCEGSRVPTWNEDFELELEGSMTLRILSFQKKNGEEGDQLLGRFALELDKQWLKGSFQEKTISMNEVSLVISVRHTPAEKTMKRTPSRTRSAVFGVEISTCARREGKTVPTIITACIREVEKRGLEEDGIYRVSGCQSDLQRIKILFDRNIIAGSAAIDGENDINAVTGVLKMYLRELPEPIFTEACYNKFVGTLKLSDEEAKRQCILRLLHELPDTNYYTIVCLLEHLVKVAHHVGKNKMSIHNLSTILGPTLLAPALKDKTTMDPLALMFKEVEQIKHQAGVVSYLLGLAFSGYSLRRSSS